MHKTFIQFIQLENSLRPLFCPFTRCPGCCWLGDLRELVCCRWCGCSWLSLHSFSLQEDKRLLALVGAAKQLPAVFVDYMQTTIMPKQTDRLLRFEGQDDDLTAKYWFIRNPRKNCWRCQAFAKGAKSFSILFTFSAEWPRTTILLFVCHCNGEVEKEMLGSRERRRNEPTNRINDQSIY